MSASKFLDTNILLYGYNLDDPVKRSTAQRFVEQGWNVPGDTAISVRVLQEFHVNLARRGVAIAEATGIVRDFADWPIMENTLDPLEAGFEEQARWNLSLWDALILAAARVSGAAELVTEDFSHWQDHGGIKVINPFG
jgi:predicted nucleic acid-binding protein